MNKGIPSSLDPTYDNSLTISENGHISIDTTTRPTLKKLWRLLTLHTIFVDIDWNNWRSENEYTDNFNSLI